MANYNAKPPEGHGFKPGQSGNPSGRPKSRLTHNKLKELIDKLSFMNREELKKVIEDPKSLVIELELASIMAQSIKTGDYSRLSFVLDRLLGKVPQVLDQNVKTEDVTASKENVTELYDIAKRLHKSRTG